jgi:NAD(P)-dependent dehydrogenase (short-subunit alcohol dehydrogenase family)
MNLDLLRGDGRVALITGAASGLGRGVARVFAEAGHRVAVVDLDRQAGEETAEELRRRGLEACFLAADVADAAAVEATFAETLERWRRLDFVMNCAGILGPRALVEDTDDLEVARLIDVNLKGTFFVCKHAVRVLKKLGGGSLLTVASIAAANGNAFFPGYSATKAGVVALTRCLARNAGRFNVRINCLSPGSILGTNLSNPLYGGPPSEQDRQRLAMGLMAQIPSGRPGSPADVAHVALFLASPLARHIHGAVVTVDGGESLGLYQGGKSARTWGDFAGGEDHLMAALDEGLPT